ncbi:FAD-binding oxidoreductase [Amycolatopsis rhabdoformis]|uniref:FAD-binding oxidoreductase n=1 Tax=Amycolatopsis rhabdoformis TaxID=1448059 RepID=A0ABZ1IFJ3_9PSEU|nr:FAD-binding oxidoreductase [Amycolatopsis rhabdoformis]WSE32314.1 FAD-binding oxidoreductase [Amycolatopsis rhabdoformis]
MPHSLEETQSIAAAHRALRTHLPAEQVHVSGPAYADSVALWNGAVKHLPAVVLTCTSPEDVALGVRTAREFGIPLSVRGRGHDYAGRALADGGLTLDLRPMHDVRVDPGARTAEVGGGASANDLLAAANEHDLVAATGTIGTVGVAGLTLGGGYGPLAGRVGLAADNLLSAELVTADGTVVRTDEHHDPDLLWALRGGGGNFGVVTSMTVRLHDGPTVVTGLVLYPWNQARQVLGRVRDAQQDSPDSLTIQVAAVAAPDGSPALLVLPTWSGDVPTGTNPSGPVMALARLGDPLIAQLDAARYADTIAGRDAMFPDGRHVTIRTRSVPELGEDVIDIVDRFGGRLPTPMSGITLHHFHGAATRPTPDDTAFVLRRPHLMTEIIGIWPAEETGEHVRSWADATSAALAEHAFPGGYANLLGPEATDQIPHIYGDNLARLQRIKAAVDPEGVFSATPLPMTEPA